ncbi:MAG: hypothetical protein NUV44_05145 [Candidatus Scalindua sp.]|nr:hypothetical protein [Candidatus Scalindua sp.]
MKKTIAAFCIMFFLTQQTTFAETDNTFWINAYNFFTIVDVVNNSPD